MEYARNVAGIADAVHAEYAPTHGALLVGPVECPVPDRSAGAPRLSGRSRVRVVAGSLTERIYGTGTGEVLEEYFCNYELNPAFVRILSAAGLRIAGLGERGEVRIVELPRPPFFVATLFLPQLRSTPSEPHPLVMAFVDAARHFSDR